MNYYLVAISRPLGKLLVYRSEYNYQTGMRVKVPLASSQSFGFIIKKVEKPEFKTKEILNTELGLRYFTDYNYIIYEWISRYYHYPIGELLKSIMPSYLPKPAILDKIQYSIKEITGTSTTNFSIELTKEQENAVKQMSDAQTYLLHGVTGSGKTEVYIEIAKQIIQQEKAVLILVPEIALTPQLLDRISKYFSGEIVVIHSSITPKQKFINWQKVLSKKARLIIGVRSAIFAPIQNLGLLVVDEEHDSSYKQSERLKYNTRDIAVMMGKLYKIPVILSSATPSVESFYNASIAKKYKYVAINKQIVQTKKTVELIDLRKTEKVSENISKPLYTAIQETLTNKQQVLIFLNRRGFSRSIVCQDCGEVFLCPNCSINLTMHKKEAVLKCHYCSFERKLPHYCHKCGSHNLKTVGTGTEKLELEIKTLFPQAKIKRVDSDILAKKNAIQELLEAVENNKIDILIGTQIIIKGHDFKQMGLVGIINTELGLQIPDFRASELTFQQIVQVNGRTARHRAGKILAQSYMPEYFAIRYALQNDFNRFYLEELENRKQLNYPPFSRIADIKMSSNTLKDLEKYSQEIKSFLVKLRIANLEILGPSPSPIEKINNRYRYHILLKARQHTTIQNVVKKLFSIIKTRDKKVRISVDIDPYSLI